MQLDCSWHAMDIMVSFLTIELDITVMHRDVTAP